MSRWKATSSSIRTTSICKAGTDDRRNEARGETCGLLAFVPCPLPAEKPHCGHGTATKMPAHGALVAGNEHQEVDMLLRAFIAFAIAFAVAAGSASAAGPKSKRQPFATPEEIQHWIKNYRAAPQPRQLPAAVKAMSRLGIFREVDNAGIYFGFVAGVVGANPSTADKLLGEMFPLPPEDQIVVVRAIAWSGHAEWKTLMARFVERMPAKRVLIERHLYGKLPGLMALALDENPAGIDALWGYYYATGSAEPIRRLITMLDWSTEAKDVDKLTAGNMVKLTLAINATRDLELMTILKREAIHQTKATARALGEVIEAAETYETAKLRKQAIAAISELKQKGSSIKRNVSFWGQVGTTALALGCVAAGVLGQVEFGLPCIIGGATASAALKVYTLEK
mgnify:CR=1 FL=1